MEHLKAKIRHVPDFPKPGILFYDITTLLCDAQGFRDTVDALAAPYMGEDIDQVIGAAFLIELDFLKGRDKLTGEPVYSVLRY